MNSQLGLLLRSLLSRKNSERQTDFYEIILPKVKLRVMVSWFVQQQRVQQFFETRTQEETFIRKLTQVKSITCGNHIRILKSRWKSSENWR